MQAGTHQDFVRLAKERPISEDRQKQFAIARTQAQMKITREQAAALVEEVWNQPAEPVKVAHGTDRDAPDVSHTGRPIKAPVDEPLVIAVHDGDDDSV